MTATPWIGRLARLAAGALLGAALMACAAPGPAKEAVRQPGPPQPAMWVIRDADSTIYLYGSLHLLKPGAPWGGPAAQTAFAESTEVWTEIDMDKSKVAEMQALVMRFGIDPTRKLSDRIDPAKKPLLEKVVAGLGVPMANFEPMRPWLAGVTFAMIPMMQAGYDPNNGVDQQIDAAARAAGKARRSFETVAEQLQFFANLPEAVQLQLLYESLAEFEKGAALLAQMDAAWSSGDTETLTKMVVTDVKAAYPEMYDVIFTQRNRRWADVIIEELKGSGVDFIVVGAGHLIGPDSVQSFLAQKGVRATQVAP
jgi:uncharacterized protein